MWRLVWWEIAHNGSGHNGSDDGGSDNDGIGQWRFRNGFSPACSRPESASRQLSRRHQALRRTAEPLRLHLLRGRPARDHGVADPASFRAPRAKSRRPSSPAASIRRNTSSSIKARWRNTPNSPGCSTASRGSAGSTHDPVQGESRQGPRERFGRSVCLSGADGGRHSGLSRDPRSGRRGSEQHLELARDIAQKFNNDFGHSIHERGYGDAFFPLPEPVITGEATRVMSLRDGSKKMSKSTLRTIPASI